MKKIFPFLAKNWLQFALVSVFAVCISTNLHAQVAPVKLWDRTFGGTGSDNLRSAQQTADGGYILGGTSNSNLSGDKSQIGRGNNDYWIVKIDASGGKVWDKTFGGTNRDDFYALKQTTDGGYIIGGYSVSGVGGDKTQPSKGGSDFWILKLDANGNKIWDKSFGGSIDDELWALTQTSDGGYILGGHSNSPVSGDKTQPSFGVGDYWIIKIDGSGNKLWDKTFGGDGPDNLFSLQQTTDGGYIAGGGSNSNLSGEKSQAPKGVDDFWIVKMDGSGNKQWDKVFGGANIENLYHLQQTVDGGYILGGESSSNVSGDKSQASRGQDDYWVVKIDALGNKLWDKTFGGNAEEELYSVKQTIDGGYILGGTSLSGISGEKSQANLGSHDFWLVKIDASGNKLWDKALGGAGTEFVSSMHQTIDGGYILGGPSASGVSTDKSQSSQGNSDFWIVKLAPEVLGAKEEASDFDIGIIPNPSQGKFKLKLNGLSISKVEVTVSDLLGRVVLQKELQVTGKQISEELEIKAAKGMFLLQIKNGEQITSRKIVIE